MTTDSFIHFLKHDRPDVWEALLGAQRQGLIMIDEENDAVTATNRLLWTYPGLHGALSTILNDWTENRMDARDPLHALLHGTKVS